MSNKIISAINELLTISDNDVDTKTNLIKVQDIFLKYKYSLKEESLKINIKEYKITIKQSKWISKLAEVIAENFSCYYIDKEKNKIIFLGRENDTYICNILLVYIINFIENKIIKMKYKCRRDGISSRGLKEEYALQFINDIKALFEEQKLKIPNLSLYTAPDSKVTIEYLQLKIEKLKDELDCANKKLKKLGRKVKFNEDKKDLIRNKSLQQKDNGKYPTVRELAKEFNCSPALICNILNERNEGKQ